MQFEQIIKQMIRDEVAACLGAAGVAEPELIGVKEAAAFCKVGEDTIRALFAERETNGFPGVVLGTRQHFVDKTRLIHWLNAGGLGQTDEPANVAPLQIVRAG